MGESIKMLKILEEDGRGWKMMEDVRKCYKLVDV